MLERIGYYWRIVGTGLSFLAFGAGGLLLRVFVFPVVNVLVRKQQLRVRLARSLIRYSFRFFIGLMRALGVVRYEIKGLEKLERGGLLILANHPTLIDTIFLMAFVKRADCIVKSALWDNPFTNGPVRAAGYIKNEEGPALLERCIASLKAGNNLIIFPEGTRTPRSGEIRFKRGAANIAVRGARKVTPVVIACTPPTLGKGEKWWNVPARSAHFSIEVQEDIDIEPVIADTENPTLAARRLTDHLQSYFSEENNRHAVA